MAALPRGVLLVEVNPEQTQISPLVDLAPRGLAGLVLPRLVALITA